VNGWAGWQWLFALEGALTALIGLVSWFYLPPSPTQTASFFRGKKGWFTEREEIILVTRVVRDDPSKGDMHNRQPITFRKFWRTLTDYDMWPFYIIGLTWLIPFTPPTAYLTLILKSLGFNTFQTNLLTIPSFVIFIIQVRFPLDETDDSFNFGHGSVRKRRTPGSISASSLRYGVSRFSLRSW